MNVYSLLIDLGGTDIKFALANGNIFLEETIIRRSFPEFVNSDAKTFDPEILIECIHKGINEYLDSSIRPSRILISGQMGSWISTSLLGLHQSNVVSWQASSFTDSGLLRDLYGRNFESENKPLLGTGNEDWPGAPWRTFASHLSSQKPEGSKKILFHTLLSWVVWELTGRGERIAHDSDAASTGLFNLAENQWIGDFVKAGFDVEFPNVTSDIRKVGNYGSSDVSVYVGVGDQQASLMGVGFEEYLYVVNAGTGGQVARQVKSLATSLHKTRPFFDGSYLETITHIPSGRYLLRLRNFLNNERGESHDWEWIWNRGNCHYVSEVDSVKQDWNIETFLNAYLEMDSTALADIIVGRICSKFVTHLLEIGCQRGDTVLLAGGVASNLKCLSEMLEGVGLQVIHSRSRETTLEGLAKLTEKISN